MTANRQLWSVRGGAGSGAGLEQQIAPGVEFSLQPILFLRRFSGLQGRHSGRDQRFNFGAVEVRNRPGFLCKDRQTGRRYVGKPTTHVKDMRRHWLRR